MRRRGFLKRLLGIASLPVAGRDQEADAPAGRRLTASQVKAYSSALAREIAARIRRDVLNAISRRRK